MALVLNKKQKAQKILDNEKKALIQSVNKFCKVDEKEKRISITHPKYNDLSKKERDKIADLKFKFGFYIQWEFFEIPAGG